MRTALFEAANALLTLTRKGSPLKSWGQKIAKKRGHGLPVSLSRVSWRSYCMPCGAMEPSSKQPQQMRKNRSHNALWRPLVRRKHNTI